MDGARGAVHGHHLSIAKASRADAGRHDARNAELTSDDRPVAGDATAIGDQHAADRLIAGTQSGFVIGATTTSPGLTRRQCSGDMRIRTWPVATPGAAARPCSRSWPAARAGYRR